MNFSNTYIHTCMHIHTYISTHACTPTYTHMLTHRHTCMHTHRHAYTHAYTYIHTHAHMHAYTPTYICAYIHTVGLQAPWEQPRCNLKPAPVLRGQGQTKERSRPLQAGMWQFLISKENLPIRFVLGSKMTSRSLYQLTKSYEFM